jgi:DNA-binding beta-propeller fold protein YncE
MFMQTMRMLVLSLVLMLSMPPSAFALYDDGARYAFMASAASKSILVIDLQKQEWVATLPLQWAPAAVVVSERLQALVITHPAAKTLTLIDLHAADLQQIDYPLSLTPTRIAMSPVGETVAIYDRQTRRLEVHDIRRREAVLAIGDVETDAELSFNADATKIYWIDESAGTFNSVDLWSHRDSISLAGSDAGLSPMSHSVDGTLAFISEASANRVHMINLQTFAPIMQVPVGSQPGRPWGTSDGRYMLVPNKGDGTVTAISAVTGAALYTVAVVDAPLFINPGWLDTAAAVVGESGRVAFINIDDGQVTARSDLHGAPIDGVVTSDSRTLAIPVPGTGSLVFFDMRQRARASTIANLPPDIGTAALAISNNLCH